MSSLAGFHTSLGNARAVCGLEESPRTQHAARHCLLSIEQVVGVWMDSVGPVSLDCPTAPVRHQDAERRLDSGLEVRDYRLSSPTPTTSREGVLIAVDASYLKIGVAINALGWLHAE